jgi:Spy/CpxP family protein refolding chaperone
MRTISRWQLTLTIGLGACTTVAAQDTPKPHAVRFPPGYSHTIRQPSVQQDLRLSGEQRKRLDEIYDEERRVMAAVPKGDRQALRDKGLERYDQVNDAVVKVLEPQQVKRFKQILWQQEGGAALGNSELREALGVTEAQYLEFRKISEEQVRKLRKEISEDDDSATRRRKMLDSRTDGSEKAVAILTPEQREQWRKLMGAPFIGDPNEPVPRRRPADSKP